GTMLVVTSPLIVAIALAVKLTSKGPVLFRQCRVGQFERHFPIWKFRTMRSEQSPQPVRDPWAPHKANRDPPVPPIGRVRRRTCQGELPQLWKVLGGDMSLVGPRPALPEIVGR